MSAELVFSLANLVALGSWILLAALPRVRWVAETLTSIVVPAALACLYVGLLLARWNSPGGFASLADVATLFSDPWLLLAGWVHYLAFDLLIGSWEVRDARQHNVPHIAVLPCLALTFLFGPAGWLLYLLVRWGRRRDQGSGEQGAGSRKQGAGIRNQESGIRDALSCQHK